MTQESDRSQLGAPAEGSWTPIVEADDGYLGGERNKGSGTAGKTRVIAAVERWPSGRKGGGGVKGGGLTSSPHQGAAAWVRSSCAWLTASPTRRRPRSATAILHPARWYTRTAPRLLVSSATPDAPTSPPSPAASVRNVSVVGHSSTSTP